MANEEMGEGEVAIIGGDMPRVLGDIMELFLLMVKQEQEKHLQWKEIFVQT